MPNQSQWIPADKLLKHAHFLPAVGRDYERSRFGLKIMLLGESHYKWDHMPADESQATLAAIQQGFDNRPFWKSIRNLFPKAADQSSQDDFWSQVLFFNYVQRMLEGPRARPKPGDWPDTRVFQEILATYQPDRILVIGKDTWRHAPGRRELPHEEPIEETRFPLPASFSGNMDVSEKYAVWYFTAGNKLALAAPIFHPAYPEGFNTAGTREVVQQLLRKEWTSPMAKAS